ncbi:MAG: hypothetical protein ACR2P1_08780 [Pseudomonadales bacterium]
MKDEIAEFKNEVVEKVKEEYSELASFLKRERDEVKVRTHLANADVQDQWRKVEAKWETFQSRASVVGKVTEESAKEVGEATKLVGAEIKEAYRRIRDTVDATKRK